MKHVAPIVVCLAFALVAATPQTNPAEAARLNNLGAAYMNQQLFEKALKAFEQAATADPNLAIARLNQGIALLNLGKVDAAKPALEAAAKRDPKDAHAWYNLGLLYKNSGDAQAAIAAFRHVTEIDPNDADTWYFLGGSYAQDKQFPQAMDAFDHALKLNPLHASAQFGLGRAYQQSGDPAKAREHLARFQYITQNKLGAAISLAYGEQGKYSLAEESPAAPPKVPAQIAVKFVDVTKDAGLVTRASSVDERKFATSFGPSACFLDYDNDGRIDVLLSNNGTQGGLSLFHNVGDGRLEDVTKKAGIDSASHAVGCTAGDFDNDGWPDIAVAAESGVILLHNEKNGTFKDVTKTAGIQSDASVFSVVFIDYDHDGDLDLYLTQGSQKLLEEELSAPTSVLFGKHERDKMDLSGSSVPGNRLWRNNGNGTFTNVTAETGTAIPGAYTAAIGTDYNNDRAVDIAVTGWRGVTAILQNPREGKFIPQFPLPVHSEGDTGIAILDFDHDGWMDLAFSAGGYSGLALWRNIEGKNFEQAHLPALEGGRRWGIAALDYDNDGWIDLAAVGEGKDGRDVIRLFRNLGPDGWKDVTADVGLDKIELKDPRGLIVGDYDNDGATDLLITQNHGPAVLLRNEGGNKNHWLRLALKGLADNKSAIGTKIEVFAGGNRQKFELAGSSGYLGQNSPYLTVGLGDAKQADVVRMLWPTGVLQDEIEVPADREQKYTEIDRRGSSCPTLFVWDGHRYALVADMLGAGVVGHWVGPNERNIPRPVEYIKVDRNGIREKDGKLSFRFMEPLEEAVYLDQVRLLAVDHPANLDVYPNEYFASNPPYPPFKVVFDDVKDARPPAGAWDEHGHNVLPDLLAHRYFGDFEVLPFAGFTKPHSLELDLGEPYNGGPLWLLMHGEIEYFSATSMYAADQAGLQPIAPYVEALGAEGKWTRVIDDMGFPAGGARTMTADFSGKLPVGTQRIRITTNLQIYWDSILVNRTAQDQEFRVTSVPLTHADLRFHGFPLKIEDKPPGNVKYVYEQASATGPYTRLAGAYTRYGDVAPLLTAFDDRLAVFASGDEVALEFNPAKLQPLPKGWVRDYFFAANGYEKDMDFYAYDFDHVDPLPFRAMGTYPYPAGKTYPAARLDDILNYDTRYMSGHEAQGYAFDYDVRKP